MESNTMEFRRAGLEDIALIRGFADIIFHKTYAEIISVEQMDYMFEWMYAEDSLKEQMQSGCVFFIARQQDRDCGFFSVELVEQARALYCLHKLYLLPEYHGTGAGKDLLNGVFGYVKGQSAKSAILQLNVNRYNKRAISFYEKMGMLKIKAKDISIGEDFYMNDYVMEICFESL